MPLRFPSTASLLDPDRLGHVLGPVRTIERSPLTTVGFSAARHERIRVSLRGGEERRLVLKVTRPRMDWTAYRTGDTSGREADLLDEPRLSGIWQIYRCPYLAFARSEGEIGMLMDDVGPWIPAVGDETLPPAQQEMLLSALARLHARFWESNLLALPTLALPVHRFSILGPRAGMEELARGSTHPLFPSVRHGWEIALSLVPAEIRTLLLRPPEEIAAAASLLPQTLLHGDAKIDNFALLPHGQVAAFDWAVTGSGVATLDLAYFLAVNWRRLNGSKERIIRSYRTSLENALEAGLPSDLWERLLSIGLLGGSLMLLWSRALALESGAESARDEWDWWIGRLVALRDRLPH